MLLLGKVGSETHFIVYYDNLDNIITGAYKKPSFEKDNYRKKYNRAYKRAVKALETKQKEIGDEKKWLKLLSLAKL